MKDTALYFIFFKMLPLILLSASVEETLSINVHLRSLQGVLLETDVPRQGPMHYHRHA